MEAIQCKLGNKFILWPGSPENPPRKILDEDLYVEHPRTFAEPNPNGPVFEYEYHANLFAWILVESDSQ